LRCCVVLITTSINAPDIKLWSAIEHPLGNCFSGTATLGDTETECVAMEEVAKTAFWTHVWVAVWCVGDWSVDNARDARFANEWNTITSVQNLYFKSIKLCWPQHVCKLIRNTVEPHGG
jgi:hypothetical protein